MIRTAHSDAGYTLDQSPLFKLHSRKKLAQLFGWTLQDLQAVARRSDNYRIFSIRPKGKKQRTVEVPKPVMAGLHRRVFHLLRRINPPNYLHSGVRGRSYITNARAHTGTERIFKLDIESYFPSTLGWHIYEFFRNVMKCSEDVAGLLTRICTCEDHVPTGSCLSQIVAFYAHFEMFEAMNMYCVQAGLRMTVYVDDITVSGVRANRSSLYQIRGMLKRRGLKSPRKKERIFSVGRPSSVTGAILVDRGIKLPNSKHQALYEEVAVVLGMADCPEKMRRIRSVLGKSVAASQLESRLGRVRERLVQEQRRLRNLGFVVKGQSSKGKEPPLPDRCPYSKPRRHQDAKAIKYPLQQ